MFFDVHRFLHPQCELEKNSARNSQKSAEMLKKRVRKSPFHLFLAHLYLNVSGDIISEGLRKTTHVRLCITGILSFFLNFHKRHQRTKLSAELKSASYSLVSPKSNFNRRSFHQSFSLRIFWSSKSKAFWNCFRSSFLRNKFTGDN